MSDPRSWPRRALARSARLVVPTAVLGAVVVTTAVLDGSVTGLAGFAEPAGLTGRGGGLLAPATGPSASRAGLLTSLAPPPGEVREEIGRERAARAEAVRAAAIRSAERTTRSARSESARRDPRSIARTMVAARGWSGDQFGCLDRLWTKESNWRPNATNPSSGAYGIPQSLPASKMAGAGADWRTNPATQIEWGLDYIADRYRTPCAAWGHSQSHNWY